MKKNHIDIERNKTVAMVHVPADSEFVFEWVFLPCVCFWCRLNMFQRGRIYHLSVTVHDNQVSLGIRIARPPRGVCKLTQHFDSSTWWEYWATCRQTDTHPHKCMHTHKSTNTGKCKNTHGPNTKLVSVSLSLCLPPPPPSPRHTHPGWPVASMTNSADILHSGSAWALFGLAEREQSPFRSLWLHGTRQPAAGLQSHKDTHADMTYTQGSAPTHTYSAYTGKTKTSCACVGTHSGK